MRKTLIRSHLVRNTARIVIVVVIAVVGVVAVSFSVAQALRRHSLTAASQLAPYDARIMALNAERMLGTNTSPAQLDAADNLAKRAIRRDATNASAVATIGIIATIRNDLPTARRIFAYGQRLSRRDYRTQLWSIEDAVLRGDIPEALRHYDIALRTSRAAPETLMPVLAGAITDEQIRIRTTERILARPAWGQTFVRLVASRGPNYFAAMRMFVSLHQKGYSFPAGAHASLIAGLMSQNSFEQAWAYYRRLNPGANRTMSRDPKFTMAPAYPSAFDWNPAQNDNISAAIQAGNKSPVFTFNVSPNHAGLLLRQLQMLPSGRYNIAGRSLGSFGSALPYWTLTCLDGRELGRVQIAGGEVLDTFAGEFTVPIGCPVQWLSLLARDSDAIEGQSGELANVALRRE